EQAAFSAYNLAPADFKRTGQLRVKGDRRPLRVQPTDVEIASGVDEHGPHVTVAFTLPAGSFATVMLRELMKTDDEKKSDVEPFEPDMNTPHADLPDPS
ncbi:MAG TPA: tRNA pseudouridine(13) synthase TruD, partial [Tepidisphaeraceae bacterium]